MDAIAQSHPAAIALQASMEQVRRLMIERGVHPARTVVLLPYLHLLPLVRELWARQAPDGFAPRFETTMTWAGTSNFVARGDDLAFDMGHDLLTAHDLLERAGLGPRADSLAARLVEAAWQLASVVAAIRPSQRAAWAANARALGSSGLDASMLALESAIASIAFEWTSVSAYAGDALLESELAQRCDLLIALEGLRIEPLIETLKSMLLNKVVSLPLAAPAPSGEIRLHQADDPSDEAERAAACVLRHINAGRVPVALVALDRVLTRRIRAMLDARGIAVRDETGWKLSTTRAAAQVMLALRACIWNASTDSVIDWLKNCPGVPTPEVLALERGARKAGLREWRSLQAQDFDHSQDSQALLEQINVWRQGVQQARALWQWLAALRALLHTTRQWPGLVRDSAGIKVIATLRLDEDAQAEFRQLPQAGRRCKLAEFTAWVSEALEDASFVPQPPAGAQVAILPFHHLLGRPFAALVLPGADEVRLQPAPEPPGIWTQAQRLSLGLPSRESLAAQVRAGWRYALQTPVCDVLWRRCSEDGEPLLPSFLVQALRLDPCVQLATDPREPRIIEARPTPRPLAVGRPLGIHQLSASAYEDLRRCPYRFFALRQLGLREVDEVDVEVGKRDFGNWLHQVLSHFHQSLQQGLEPVGAGRVTLLDAAAEAVTRSLRLDAGEFLAFTAAWPSVRDGYLDWLSGHEAQGARFVQAESRHEMPLGPLQLVGRIDRIDRFADGSLIVLDYKTESPQATRSRIKQPAEDTQLAFYAALLEHDTLRAGYVNVGERGETDCFEQEAVVAVRDMLVHGLLDDVRRINAGAPMAALGEGKACDFCAARGLCRRDFWNE